jgi:hypothetical protein
VSIEYIAAVRVDDYEAFKLLMTIGLPSEHEMWLRVKERGNLRAFKEGGAICTEVEVSRNEFNAYCPALKRPDRTIGKAAREAEEEAGRARGVSVRKLSTNRGQLWSTQKGGCANLHTPFHASLREGERSRCAPRSATHLPFANRRSWPWALTALIL